MFDILSDAHRRRILGMLAEANPRDEDEFTPEDIKADDEDLERFTLELYHRHLPKLDDAGYIEWDHETNTIRRGPRFETVAPLIKLMRDHEDELPAGWP